MKTVKLLLLLLIGSSLHAQKFYGGAGGGYNFPLAQNVIINWQTADIDTTVTGSFGKGWSVAIFGGYAFSKHVCAEMRVEGWHSATYIFTNNNRLRPAMTYDGYNEMHLHSLQFQPSIRLQNGGDPWNFYLRQGVAIGLNKEFHYNKIMQGWESRLEKSGGISLGYVAGAGVSRRLGKSLSVYAECQATIMSWAPKRGEYTLSIYQGKDQMDKLSVSQKEIVYLDTVSANQSYDPTQPSWEKRKFLPMSAIGFSVGIQFCN